MLLKTIGSIFIFTGTAVGAGMLAIPLVTADIGFLGATLLLVGCYILMLYTALLILEVNLAFPAKTSFSTMAEKTIGPIGKTLTWLSFCLLLYALCSAYISGGASLLKTLSMTVFHVQISETATAFAFTLILGGFIFMGTRAVDKANRLLMSTKLISFFLLAIILVPHVHSSLLLKRTQHWHPYLFALPILLTSFGSHVVIPSIRAYMGDDPKRLRLIILVGGTLPLIIYLLWELVTLGVLPYHGPYSFTHIMKEHGSVGQMVLDMQHYLHRTTFSVFVNIFTDVAISTSFLGVGLGLFDFMADGCRLNKQKLNQRFLLSLIVFAIPLGFAIFYPNGFIVALSYASIFVAILLVILPAWMSYCLRKKGEFVSTYRPKGNNFVLGVVGLCGVLCILPQLFQI